MRSSNGSMESLKSINNSVGSQGSVVSINRYVDGKPTEHYFKYDEEINKSIESGKIKSKAKWFKKRRREYRKS